MHARLLDISRLISRVGRGPLTGVDRVELAYYREFLKRDAPVFFLCRLPKSYALLDRQAGQEILNRILGNAPWGRQGMARVLAAKSNPAQQSAIADVWRLATRTYTPNGLKRRLARVFPKGVTYFNVGHSNLRGEVFAAITAHKDNSIIVLIHDVIPLTSPNLSTSEVSGKFKAAMQLVSANADKIIYNSKATQQEAEAIFSKFGRVPNAVVAHLATEVDTSGQRFDSATEKPSFVTLGTIEPRKNHALLLNIWQEFSRDLDPQQIPDLHIIGQRGWNNTSVFSILDSDPMMGKHVFENNNLPDVEVQQRLGESWALLFPSHVEGFGLPLIEAAAKGVPILCGENAIYREILGNYPLYLNVDNSYIWSKRILERAGRKRESEAERQVRGRSVKLPDWNMHFDRIFRFV